MTPCEFWKSTLRKINKLQKARVFIEFPETAANKPKVLKGNEAIEALMRLSNL